MIGVPFATAHPMAPIVPRLSMAASATTTAADRPTMIRFRAISRGAEILVPQGCSEMIAPEFLMMLLAISAACGG